MRDDPDNFDRLIDDVARGMTGEPPAGGYEALARRVSVRIQDADAARAPRVWSRTWLLAPAAACVALLAVFLLRDMNVRLTTSAPATAVKKPDATPVQPALSPRPGPDAASETRSGFRTQGPVTLSPLPSALSPLPSALSPEPLTADSSLQPLTMAPIELASLDVSPLVVVMPIEISTIAIERIEISAMP